MYILHLCSSFLTTQSTLAHTKHKTHTYTTIINAHTKHTYFFLLGTRIRQGLPPHTEHWAFKVKWDHQWEQGERRRKRRWYRHFLFSLFIFSHCYLFIASWPVFISVYLILITLSFLDSLIYSWCASSFY